ncbi:hypothetical protein WJX77_002103 [Trebouxia sp. C0004]
MFTSTHETPATLHSTPTLCIHRRLRSKIFRSTMTQAKHFALAALVLSSAFVAPALAARQLKQTTGTINFPGCTFLQDSEIARNQDFSSSYGLLQSSGLSSTLSNLSSPATIFVPTNEAVAEYLMAANLTMAEAASSPCLAALLSYHAVFEAIMSESSFTDNMALSTMLAGTNLTIITDEINGTEYVTVESFGSETTIVTPAAFACNLVIYGIDGVLVPEEDLLPFNQEFLQYLETTLEPGFAEVPLSLVIAAVQANNTNTVAEAADQAISMGYLQQLTALIQQASGNTAAINALAAVGNEMIMMTSCANVTPLIRQAMPSAATLGVSNSTLASMGAQYPALASCVTSVV